MALSDLAAPPFHDNMNINSCSSAFQQDDLWTACGGYEAGSTLLNLDDELSNMVSMVNLLHQGNAHHQEVFSSGLHRNASFDSGHSSLDSCTASFSTGSPVTVLPPLPYSLSTDSKEKGSSCVPFVDAGLWVTQDQASSDRAQMLPSLGVEHFSLLMNESPLRSYEEGVRQIGGNRNYRIDVVVPASNCFSSHQSHQNSENSESTLDSVLTAGANASNLYNSNHLGRKVSSSSNPLRISAVQSDVSPTVQHSRLSWTDHNWPAKSTSDRMPVPLPNFQSTTGAHSLLFPGQFVNGFNSNGNHTRAVVAKFQDADYLETCNHYRNTQLRDSNNFGAVATNNSFKRSYSAMQSIASNNNLSSSLSPVKFSSVANKQRREAAAISALLYKSNIGSDLMEKARAGSCCVSAAGAACGNSATVHPPPKLRRRHGTATDPQSIAARTRRERFSDRIKLLQCLVPYGERLDTVSMLGHTLEYVRFLQHQVWQLYNGSDDLPQPDSQSREKWKEFMDTTQSMAMS